MLGRRLFFRFLVVCSFFLPLYFWVGALKYLYSNQELQRIGVKTNAKICNIDEFTVEDDDGNIDTYYYYTITYKDEHGRTYLRRLDDIGTRYRMGTELSVIYHPDTPREPQIYSSFNIKSYPFLNLIFSIIFWGVCLRYWIFDFMRENIAQDILNL